MRTHQKGQSLHKNRKNKPFKQILNKPRELKRRRAELGSRRDLPSVSRLREKAENSLGSVSTGTCLLTGLRVVGAFSGSHFWSPSNVDLKNKTASYFTLHLGMAKELQLGHASYGKTLGKTWDQRRGTLFYREKEEVGRGCSEWKSIGGKQKFRVVRVSHWQSYCWAWRKTFLPPVGVGK